MDIAARLDAHLAEGLGDGWRYDVLPDDRTAIVGGVRGINTTARLSLGSPFPALPAARQDEVLAAVQDGSARGGIWRSLPPKRFFEELLVLVTQVYYAQPAAQDRIGYVGMADAKGFHQLGLNRRDPVEIEGSDAPF